MRIALTILFVITLGCYVQAQQVPLSSQYLFNKLVINPAFAGNENVLNSTLTYRTAFTGFDGQPVTQSLTSHAPIPGYTMGVGLKVLNDKIGVINTTNISGIYAYRLRVGQGNLAMGIEFGLINTKIDFATVRSTANDPDDPIIPQSAESKITPDAAFGIYYHHPKLIAGFSIQQLISSKIDFPDLNRNIVAQLKQHYYLIAGYRFIFGDDGNFVLEPSTLVKAVGGAPSQVDLNLRAEFVKMFSVGASYRTSNEIVIFGAVKYQNTYSIGYAYDLSLSSFNQYHGGSHEIMLNYNLKLPEPPQKKVIDPRYYIKDVPAPQPGPNPNPNPNPAP